MNELAFARFPTACASHCHSRVSFSLLKNRGETQPMRRLKVADRFGSVFVIHQTPCIKEPDSNPANTNPPTSNGKTKETIFFTVGVIGMVLTVVALIKHYYWVASWNPTFNPEYMFPTATPIDTLLFFTVGISLVFVGLCYLALSTEASKR